MDATDVRLSLSDIPVASVLFKERKRQELDGERETETEKTMKVPLSLSPSLPLFPSLLNTKSNGFLTEKLSTSIR